MKRILVPTDFSNNAYSALFYATRLFQNEACEFFILNTFEVQTPVLTSRIDTSKGEALFKKLSVSSQDQLKALQHKIVRDSEDLQHSFETISVSKALTETINKTVQTKNIDLIVMGTKGATGAKEIFMGSNTVKVIQKTAGCPVLMIPNQFQYKKPLQIAFPSDFKRFYIKEEIKPLIDLAKINDSSIRIFHIHEKSELDMLQEYHYNTLKKYLQNFDITLHWVSNFTKKSKLINDFIKDLKIDILVMVNYKHSFMESITHEPIIKKIGFQPTVPFLVIPDAS